MPSIKLDNASVRFPIYDAWNRSFKHRFVNTASFGELLSEQNKKIYVDALSEVSIEIEPGDRIAVLGGNGSGKTTLLRAIGGLVKPSGGQVEINGLAMAIMNIGYGFDPLATVYDNIVMQGILLGKSKSEIRKAAGEISDFSELSKFMLHPLRNLSPGHIFRLGTGSALFFGAEIILYDEMMETADPSFLAKTKDYIEKSLPRETIIIVVERSRAVLEGLCNKALVLEEGKIVDHDEFDSIMSRHEADYLL